MTTIFDTLLERAFGKSGKLSNMAITCAFVSFLSIGMFLCAYSAAGLTWARYGGVSSYILAIGFCVVAFSAQTVTQIIRIISNAVAKNNGQEPRVFKEDDPLYAKLIKKAYRATKEKGVNLFSPLKVHSFSKTTRVNVHVRANARTHRRASRPAFARSSDEGSSDSSEDSDSGDSIDPSYSLTFPTLFSFNSRKRNIFSRPQRFSSRYGCWHVRRHRRSWRWSA